jgi:hypothetical protein
MGLEPEPEPITPEFIELMVDKIIGKLSAKLEELDISMDYVAAALLDTDAVGLGSRQKQRGRVATTKSHSQNKDK